ncbi:MAG: hypothetical protein WBC01_10735, partial [Solirubrobacterales bacterium]
PALLGAGLKVFTAPVAQGGKQPPDPCSGAGEPLPTGAMTIDSNGEIDDNGAALALFLGFLRDNYGVTEVHIVGHSDGGLWSRSALTQDGAYAGISVLSLTTLGTPHTGSFVADLTVELNGGKCNFSNRVEQAICDAMSVAIAIVVEDLGPLATKELTSGFLRTWNPQQTIGRCPVNGIAGDHVGFNLPFLDYYTPSDGLVGEASALAEASTDISGYPIPAPEIPDFREAGIYDVVHGTSMRILSKKNLLNTPAISEKVVETITSGAEDCNVGAAGPSPTLGSAAEGADAERAGSASRLRVPLYRLLAADARGRMPAPGDEDFAVSKRGVTVRCGRTPLQTIPIIGDPRLRLHPPGGCDRKLRARNKKSDRPARALLLRAHPRRDGLIELEGERARIRIRGKQPRNFSAQARVGGQWRSLELDRTGRATLPDSGAELSLRLRVARLGKGKRPDTGHVSLAR